MVTRKKGHFLSKISIALARRSTDWLDQISSNFSNTLLMIGSMLVTKKQFDI